LRLSSDRFAARIARSIVEERGQPPDRGVAVIGARNPAKPKRVATSLPWNQVSGIALRQPRRWKARF
jgi:hypothetical protein